MAIVEIDRSQKPHIARSANGSVATIKPSQGVGPKGDTGDTGPQGIQGDQGDQGPTGDTGDQGLPGPGAAAWTAAQAVTTGSVRQAPDGSWIKSTTNRTTGATFDVTEQGFWTPTFATAGTLEEAALTASIADTSVPVTINLKAAAPTSGSNDTTAVQAALTALDAAGGGLLRIPRGTWTFTGSTGLSLTGTTNPILIEAEDGAVFDFTGSTALTALTLGGSAGSSAALGADVAKHATAITCALSVAAGDLILIQSTVNWETLTSQKQGEFAEVLSVSGGVITIKGGLYDTYTAATTTVTKINAPTVSITGRLRVKRNGNVRGVEVTYARNVLLSGLDLEGARERLLYLNYVYNVTIAHCTGRDFWEATSGTNYGICIAAAQHVREIGNDFRGGRHALSHGGFVPCRDIQIIGGTFDNYHASGQKSVDFHPSCENVAILGATILNGLNSQASNLYVGAGTRIRGIASEAVEIGPARDCDYIKLDKVDITSATGKDGFVYIARNGSNATTLGLLWLDATIRAGAACVNVYPNSSTQTGATIDRAVIRGDFTAGGTSACVTWALATAAYVGINDLTIEATPRMYAPAGDGFNLTATSTGRLRIKGRISAGKNLGKPVNVIMFGDVKVSDAELHGATPYRSNFQNSGVLTLDGVLIDGGSSSGGLVANAGPSEARVTNVRAINVTGSPSLPARHYNRVNSAGKVVTSGTAAPTTGAWAVGDICENTAPAAGGVSQWVCVTAGTPGTWAASQYVGAVITSTTTALAAIGNAINTADKYAGKTVYNTTTKKLVTADGSTAAAVWVDATGTTAHTPV